MVGLKLSFVFIFQGWVLLMSNASFALGVATEIIRILFLSGYGMVNFVFGVAVYFSALFYLVKYAKSFLFLYWILLFLSERPYNNQIDLFSLPSRED